MMCEYFNFLLPNVKQLCINGLVLDNQQLEALIQLAQEKSVSD